jgi:hypothetical protein
VVAKVEWHPSELYPCVGFILTNLARPAERVVAFYNQRGTAEQWIKEGEGAINGRGVLPKGLPERLTLTTGEAHDSRLVFTILSGLKPEAMSLADRGYDTDWIRTLVSQWGAWAAQARFVP